MADFYKILEAVKNLRIKTLLTTIMDASAGHDHDGTNSKAVTVGTVADSAITNAKLATDVKIGSVAALTTTEKASIVGSINELVTSVAAVNKDAVETLTNKTLTSPIINTPLLGDGSQGLTITSANQTHAAPTATVPNIVDAADSFVMNDTIATLTLKTLTTPVIASLCQDAGKTKVMTIPDTASDTLVALAATQVLTNKHLTSAHLTTPLIEDGDAGISITSANQTHAAPTVTIPDIVDDADEFVMKNTAATLTLKTLTAPVITTPSLTYGVSAHDYAAGAVDWTLSAGEIATQILTPTNANAPAAIIGPATSGRAFYVVNGSGQAITVKKAGGTGVQIANAKAALVAYVGSDYVRLSGDA